MTKKNNNNDAEISQQDNEEAVQETQAEDTEVGEAEAKIETADEKTEFETLKKDLEEMKNRYYRALADYQNLQRRSAKEILEARNRGVEDFVKKLLPVIDTMEKAVEQISQTNVDKKVMDGLEMFSIQFTDVLEKEGLKPIPAKGKKFDPNYHEAMCKRTDENVEDEIVLTEFEKGYTFRERVLRTAKVEINNR
ncbi:MAG: molecular chaperone GrpE [Clostridiales bacterium]|jgi:molecular chaperone GrpE|nr:molecular chaperone GrpE [Clostridiales bacterium]MDN5283024.1 molecular chaperone GrpE [Candidatus Ozemobacter sp.]